jgi:hypothetical protein
LVSCRMFLVVFSFSEIVKWRDFSSSSCVVNVHSVWLSSLLPRFVGYSVLERMVFSFSILRHFVQSDTSNNSLNVIKSFKTPISMRYFILKVKCGICPLLFLLNGPMTNCPQNILHNFHSLYALKKKNKRFSEDDIHRKFNQKYSFLVGSEFVYFFFLSEVLLYEALVKFFRFQISCPWDGSLDQWEKKRSEGVCWSNGRDLWCWQLVIFFCLSSVDIFFLFDYSFKEPLTHSIS